MDRELLAAVAMRNGPGVMRAVEAGADINGRDANGRTALHHIAQEPMGERDTSVNGVTLQWLRLKNADANIPDYAGNLPLHYYVAVHGGEPWKVMIPRSYDTDNLAGETALHWAVTRNHAPKDEFGLPRWESWKWLIKQGADINVRDNEGRTPLHWALSIGNTEAAHALIEAGADLNIPDNHGCTPLCCVALQFKTNPFNSKALQTEVFSPRDRTMQIAHDLPPFGNERTLTAKMLVEQGADIGQADEKAQALLEKGQSIASWYQDRIEPEFEDPEREADMLVECTSKAACRRLYKIINHSPLPEWLQGKLEEKEDRGIDILQFFASHPEGVKGLKALKAGGVDMRQANEYSSNLLHTAAASGTAESLRWLLQIPEVRENDLEGTTSSGDTPLHIAVLCSSADACLELIGAGANVSAKAIFDQTPLHYVGLLVGAEETNEIWWTWESYKICRALLAAGADPEALAAEGEKPRIPGPVGDIPDPWGSVPGLSRTQALSRSPSAVGEPEPAAQ